MMVAAWRVAPGSEAQALRGGHLATPALQDSDLATRKICVDGFNELPHLF